MKTFIEFQQECFIIMNKSNIDEGIVDNLRRFIPKSNSPGGYTGQLQRYGQGVAQQVSNRVGQINRPISGGINRLQGYGQRVAQQVSNRVGQVNQPISGGINRLQRYGQGVAQQVSNRVGSEVNKVKSTIAPTPKITNRNDGSSRDSSKMNMIDKIRGSIGAAREAVPAIAAGALGINRTDRNISPAMEKEIKAAHSRALARGSKNIDYKDYADTPAGFAASKTMGRIGDSDWKRDNKGKITGLRQKYDTDKSPRQLGGELWNAVKRGNVSQMMYKPAEIALSLAQRRGLTTHDVDFNKKPGENRNNSMSLSKQSYSPNQINAYSTATAPIRNVRNALQTPAQTLAQRTGVYGRYAPPSMQQRTQIANRPTNRNISRA